MPILLLVGSPVVLLSLLLYLVIFLVVAGLIFWSVNKLTVAFGIPEPVKTVIIVALVIIMVIGIIYFLVGGVGAPLPR